MTKCAEKSTIVFRTTTGNERDEVLVP